MFNFFRKNIKVFIWLIVLAFIVWGAGSSITAFLGDSSSYAGKIGKERISQREFLTLFRFYEMLMQPKPPEVKTETPKPAEAKDKSPEEKKESSKTEPAAQDSVRQQTAETAKPAVEPPKPPAFEEVKAMTWQTIILNREAKKRKIRIADEEVADEIQKQFSGGGNNFNQEFYEAWVRKNFRGEPREFEEALREHLTIQKVRAQILKDVPEADRDKHWLEFLAPVLSNGKFVDYTEKSKS